MTWQTQNFLQWVRHQGKPKIYTWIKHLQLILQKQSLKGVMDLMSFFFFLIFVACSYELCWDSLAYFTSMITLNYQVCYLLQNGGFSKTIVSELFWHKRGSAEILASRLWSLWLVSLLDFVLKHLIYALRKLYWELVVLTVSALFFLTFA